MHPTKRSIAACLAVLLIGLAASPEPIRAAETPAKIKVLLLTGDDVEPAHNWQSCAQAVREALSSAGKFEVRICEDPAILDSAEALQRYDLVFLALFNAKTPTLSAAAKANLVSFVKGGKGFVASHLASASFKEWDEFKELCGRYWVMGKSGHGPRSEFTVKIVDKTSPITQGMTDFKADDELYAKLEGTAPIHVLVEADSDWSKRTEPLAFTRSYGQGRVFHEAFGHDVRAIQNPSVTRLIQRGCEWAATGQVK
jgi:uncharacterized protein